MVKLTTLQWRHTNSQLLHDNSSMGQLAISFQPQMVTKVLFRIPILKSVFNVPIFNWNSQLENKLSKSSFLDCSRTQS